MELNLTTLALALFVVIAGFVLLRGALRILLGTLVLSSSAWVGFRLWQITPTWSYQWFGQPVDWLSIALPAAGFITVFLTGRLLVKFLASPFQKSPDSERKPLTITRLIGAALFTLVPTAILGAVAVLFLNHAGSIQEIKTSAAGAPPATGSNAQLFENLKTSIVQSIPADWLKLLDPLSDPSRLNLAKLIASKTPPKPEIDPTTGKPIPRAIIVDDPQLKHLAKSGDYASLLHSPALTEALKDPKVQAAIKSLQTR